MCARTPLVTDSATSVLRLSETDIESVAWSTIDAARIEKEKSEKSTERGTVRGIMGVAVTEIEKQTGTEGQIEKKRGIETMAESATESERGTKRR